MSENNYSIRPDEEFDALKKRFLTHKLLQTKRVSVLKKKRYLPEIRDMEQGLGQFSKSFHKLMQNLGKSFPPDSASVLSTCSSLESLATELINTKSDMDKHAESSFIAVESEFESVEKHLSERKSTVSKFNRQVKEVKKKEKKYKNNPDKYESDLKKAKSMLEYDREDVENKTKKCKLAVISATENFDSKYKAGIKSIVSDTCWFSKKMELVFKEIGEKVETIDKESVPKTVLRPPPPRFVPTTPQEEKKEDKTEEKFNKTLWYYCVDGGTEQQGPFALGQLKDMFANGVINDDTNVYAQSVVEEYTTLKEVKGLLKLLNKK